MAHTLLRSAPGLAPMLVKAALTGPLHRGGDLPDSSYELGEQRIDREHLAAYDRVCGFRFTDRLPPTYLHVLAFPLSIALMTERSFPFPLVGAIHVRNSITVHRPVTLDEPVSVTVRGADLRAHPAGRQFDLLAEATVGGEAVWAGRSTYLSRGGDRAAVRPVRPPNAAEPPSAATALVEVPADMGRRYAAVSGDWNPIHLHRLTARAFGFGTAIAHGMWLKARTLAVLEGRLPDAYTVEVAFKTAVPLPSAVAVTATQEEAGWRLDVRNSRSGKPHLSGTVSGTG
jgi:acyl dehydratase